MHRKGALPPLQEPQQWLGGGSHYSSFTERYPYLDLIATSQHIPLSTVGSSEQWKHTLVQPVVIPSLAHTGIRSVFDEYEESVTRPDGHVTGEFKACIQKELRELPQLPLWTDVHDMKRRARDPISQQVLGGNRRRKHVAPTVTAAARSRDSWPAKQMEGLREDSTFASSEPQPRFSMGRRLVQPGKRLKKPYSHDSLVRSLIDFNFTPADQPLEWEVKGVTYVLTA